MIKEVKRPWGRFKQFVFNKQCTVKILIVKPRQELSLQKHRKRTEQWYFLTDGIAQIGNKKINIKKDSIIIIPKMKTHRLIAKNKEIRVLEISLGKFDEKDEIRVEDKYGRK